MTYFFFSPICSHDPNVTLMRYRGSNINGRTGPPGIFLVFRWANVCLFWFASGQTSPWLLSGYYINFCPFCTLVVAWLCCFPFVFLPHARLTFLTHCYGQSRYFSLFVGVSVQDLCGSSTYYKLIYFNLQYLWIGTLSSFLCIKLRRPFVSGTFSVISKILSLFICVYRYLFVLQLLL